MFHKRIFQNFNKGTWLPEEQGLLIGIPGCFVLEITSASGLVDARSIAYARQPSMRRK